MVYDNKFMESKEVFYNMKLTYLGHSAFLIETENINIIIDPFIKDNPLCKTEISKLPKIHYVLVTHGHSDHLGDTVEIARKFGSYVICNYEIAQYLDKYNIKCHAMHIGGRKVFDFGKIKMTPAIHGSSITESTHILYAGVACGFLIEIGGIKIYHAGDTALTYDMKLLEKEHIDYALLPIGGNFTMDIEDSIEALSLINPKNAIPMHYNTFDLIKANPKEFSSDTCDIIHMNPNESIDIT